ncbi:interferon-inducible GTPase (IIGP) domain-containing protein [Pochonia chlamydosporia 170]|uniref:Interferon-inducible GTPase (IIGP) domain-containing protein n=1 Tax=Pochonia chlamydosporia 170 TaxID=1380566 RepID=A0A179FD29_METCM|nr:interferon-inducible GTPase (IIGP) domain-containing protein [Pochonia chlamydosporia 170]OAQ63475.1 interferon-inducible GTPase (IIGP) domain-containing protein [Pochonia chlamydosporia 170]
MSDERPGTILSRPLSKLVNAPRNWHKVAKVLNVGIVVASNVKPYEAIHLLAFRRTETVQQQRIEEGFEADAKHVGVCGLAGTGKSSLINALRSLSNDDLGAAGILAGSKPVERAKYSAHDSSRPIILHDCPGAMATTKAAEYYHSQRMYLFDTLLIVTVQYCLLNGQPFRTVRSRSDEMVARIRDEKGCSLEDAKPIYAMEADESWAGEFSRDGAPQKIREELLRGHLLVNKNDLLALAREQVVNWPQEKGQTELHERRLLTLVSKVGTGPAEGDEDMTL